jgi:hypothetical protein
MNAVIDSGWHAVDAVYESAVPLAAAAAAAAAPTALLASTMGARGCEDQTDRLDDLLLLFGIPTLV